MIPKIFVRSGFPFNYDTDKASDESAVVPVGETLTQQHMAEEADINTIVRRFGVTGVVPQGVRAPTFADFEDVFDFQSAQNALIEADRSFMAMAADTRSRFENSPQKFVEFCSAVGDDGVLINLEEMRKLGLAVPKKEEPPVAPPLRAQVVPEAKP